jgi:hypothetical protein
MIIGFFFQLFIAAPFAALGGLLGAAVFARPATPPSMQPPTIDHEPPTTS